MKLKCTKSNLINGINIVSKAVPSKTTMSILECILIHATTDDIKLTANDMELGIETAIEGDTISSGMIALNAKIFSEIIRKLPDGEVTIETEENYKTTIYCEKSKFVIMARSGEDFSSLPYIEKDNYIYLSQFTLKEMIRQTIFSVADSNESNKTMTGELFEIKGSMFNVISLDGHRISIRTVELRESFNNIKVIVPGKTLTEISKILSGDTEDEVKIYFTNNHILFEFNHTIVVSRLIEGEYLRVHQMLSKDYETKVIINRKEFLSCIERSILLVREGEKRPVVIKISEGEMAFRINTSIGSMDENVNVKKEGKDLVIAFNPKFLIDVLRVIDDEDVNIHFMNPKAPCYIRDDEHKYIYFILPVNFNEAMN